VRVTEGSLADARSYVEHYGLAPQREGEDDAAFVERVAVELRRLGRIIEAHELMAGHRHDQPPEDGPNVVHAGVAGAIAQALAEADGRDLQRSRDGRRRLDEEFLDGMLATGPPDPAREALGAMFDVLGPAGAMDFLDATRRKP
jgi:hypothetical protein